MRWWRGSNCVVRSYLTWFELSNLSEGRIGGALEGLRRSRGERDAAKHRSHLLALCFELFIIIVDIH